jgi:hypothetical protein
MARWRGGPIAWRSAFGRLGSGQATSSVAAANWVEGVALAAASIASGCVLNPIITIYREQEVGFRLPAGAHAQSWWCQGRCAASITASWRRRRALGPISNTC